MGKVALNRGAGDTGRRRLRDHQWLRCLALIVLLVSSGLRPGAVRAAERDRPFRIGVLTGSWGPTPHVLSLRDGLRELGYRENEDFDLGARFTRGETAALPTAARQLVQYEEKTMSRACPVCHHLIKETRIRHVQTWHDQVVVFDHVPAEVCDHCGEILLAGWVVDKINNLLWSKAPATQTILASLYDLSDLPAA